MTTDVLAIAARAQAVAESLMVDTCTITRPGATPNGEPLTVYSGKCRVRMTPRMPDLSQSSPGTALSRHVQEIHIPVSATGVQFNDLVTITASLNPSLVDTTSYIDGPMGQTFGSAQRLWCQREFR